MVDRNGLFQILTHEQNELCGKMTVWVVWKDPD